MKVNALKNVGLELEVEVDVNIEDLIQELDNDARRTQFDSSGSGERRR